MHEKELMKEADLSMLEVFKQNQNQTQKGLMEEIKMTESQSRYGIMDELSNKKLKAKEKLAKLEKETDQIKYEAEKVISDIEEKIRIKEQNYTREHEVWKKELTVQKEMAEKEHKRKMDNTTALIAERDRDYVGEFDSWKADKLLEVIRKKAGNDRYMQVQDKAIQEQNSILAEIDASIKNLKEMSAEQKKD